MRSLYILFLTFLLRQKCIRVRVVVLVFLKKFFFVSLCWWPKLIFFVGSFVWSRLAHCSLLLPQPTNFATVTAQASVLTLIFQFFMLYIVSSFIQTLVLFIFPLKNKNYLDIVLIFVGNLYEYIVLSI